MPAASAPIRLDRELDASAREMAKLMSRSVAEQVSHWARLGREIERSPEVSVLQVRAVLAGQANYDSLAPAAQAVVRAQWERGIDAMVSGLDLAADFAAQGHRYAELDESGQIRVVTAPA
jgi:hypothetical protein